MKDKLTYKKFIKISKYVVGFSKLNFFSRLIFYLEAPLRYLKLGKIYKEELKERTEKKEVTNND